MYYSYSDRKRNDFFICSNNHTTGARKRENLYALYSILEYCEEPYLCRRQMQLMFLGEEFKASKCDRMCDNCRNGLVPIQKDRTEEACKIIGFLKSIS